MQRATRVLRKAAHSHGHSDGNKYGGFHAPHVDPFHQNMATIIGATMWFWIFYRFREDGGVLLGFHKPWEAHAHDEGHGDEEHGHGAGHDEHSKELRRGGYPPWQLVSSDEET